MPLPSARPDAERGGHRRIGWALLALVPLVGLLVSAQTAEAASEVHLVAAGDFGARAATNDVLARMAAASPDAALAVGDFAYTDVSPESAWCAFVKARVGEGFPLELESGNHESLDVNDGAINDFAACLPNQIPGIVGTYGREYYMDLPQNTSTPLVRVVNTAPTLLFDDGRHSYTPGDPYYTWLANAIDSARASGIRWIVVTAHIPCLSMGSYTCPSSRDFYKLVVDRKVDLVLHGHEHGYMRTHQLTAGTSACPTLAVGTYDADCVVDRDSAYSAGAGTVFATVGTGGTPLRDVNTADTEAPYFAKYSGLNLNPTHGYLDLRATATGLVASFVPTAPTGMTDQFRIDSPTTLPPTVLAQDSFDRTLASGWGTAATGGAWTANPATALAVGSGVGTVSSAAGAARSAILQKVSSKRSDLVLSFGVDKVATGSGLQVSAVGRWVSGVGEYRAKARLRSDRQIELSLLRATAAGVETQIGSAVTLPGLSYTAGANLKLRLQVSESLPTSLRARVWSASGLEPSTWAVTGVDSTDGLQTSGGIGIRAYLSSTATNAPVTLKVDDILVSSP